MQKTKTIKIPIDSKWGLRKTIKYCGDTIREAKVSFLKKNLANKTHYAVSQLVELKLTYVKYRLILVHQLDIEHANRKKVK